MKRALNILSRLAGDVHLMFQRPARVQYAALCYRLKKKRSLVEILLITSRDTGRWVIPKGWPMSGKTAAAAAQREAYEEAGVKGVVRPEAIGHYMYEKRMQEGLKVNCKVQVYALEVDDLCKSFPEKGERQSEWVDCEEAARRVNEPGLKKLILDFEKMHLPDTAPTVTKIENNKAR
jgi:8-oxo-dGTP pyrophosphatase MutT (NUDIX family)